VHPTEATDHADARRSSNDAARSSNRDKRTDADQGGRIMVRYFYAWTPLVIVAAIVLLSMPWLGLVALMIVALVALAALVWAVVYVPYMLSRAISRRWHMRIGASPRTAPALAPARRQDDSAWQEHRRTRQH
jgi:hypothetical protein